MIRREFMKFVGVTVGSGFIPLSLLNAKSTVLAKKKTVMPWYFCWYSLAGISCRFKVKFEHYSEISEVAFKKSMFKYAEKIEKKHPLPKGSCWCVVWIGPMPWRPGLSGGQSIIKRGDKNLTPLYSEIDYLVKIYASCNYRNFNADDYYSDTGSLVELCSKIRYKELDAFLEKIVLEHYNQKTHKWNLKGCGPGGVIDDIRIDEHNNF